MDFDETWYGGCTQGPLQVLLFFGQIRSGVDPGRNQNRSMGVPFFKELLLQTGRPQERTHQGTELQIIFESNAYLRPNFRLNTDFQNFKKYFHPL